MKTTRPANPPAPAEPAKSRVDYLTGLPLAQTKANSDLTTALAATSKTTTLTPSQPDNWQTFLELWNQPLEDWSLNGSSSPAAQEALMLAGPNSSPKNALAAFPAVRIPKSISDTASGKFRTLQSMLSRNLVAAAQGNSVNLDAVDNRYHLTSCGCQCCGPNASIPGGEEQFSVSGTAVAAPAPAASLQTLADYLRAGYWTDTSWYAHKYNLSSSGSNPNSGILYYNLSGWSLDADGISLDHRDMVREVFKLYGLSLGISFQETTSTGDEVDFFFSDNKSGAYASAYINTSLGITDYAEVNVESTWNSGISGFNTYTFQTFLHEIGHALGLGHQGYYNGSGSYSTDADFANDSWQLSMMSYFNQTQNPTTGASYVFLQTPMSVDWLALDDIYRSYGYGINNAFNGDTVYGVGTTIGATSSRVWNEFSTYASSTAYTIADASGYDTLDVSNFSANQVINLSPSQPGSTIPSISNIGGLLGNLTLAAGTVIEAANGGSGNDTFYGNNAANTFRGGGGSDSFYDSLGSDNYYGDLGIDYLYFSDSLNTFNYTLAGDALSFSRNTSSVDVDLAWNSIENISFNSVVYTYQQLVNSLGTSDITPPTVTALSVNGSTLTLTLNEALSSVVPANTCFSVLVDGVLRTVNSAVVNTSNNTVDLTLASAVTAGQSVTLAYTDATTANDTTGIIQDVALNDLASFTARTVTNNSTLTDDYSANTSTTGLVNIGSSASGNLQFIGDHDWFSVSLTAGSAYTFQQISGSLSDPLLTLRDSTGNIITSNDDNPFGGTTNSLISFTAAYTGNYYLDAGSFLDNLTGTYSLTAAASDITPPTVTALRVNGSTLTLTLNEALSSVVPANTCFSVLVDGVLRTVNSAVVNTSNNTVDLTLASAVTAGQSVTLAYTDATTANDTTGIIQDVALNDLASFTARTVTNNSTLTDDYSANTSTTGLVNIGSSASGNLQFIGDHDWFSVSLTAGSAYTFQQISGSLSDPLLTLRDSTGNIITSNDDNPFGGTTNSLISFTAAYTGNYYLDAGSFLDNLTGTYSLTAAASDITPPTVTALRVNGSTLTLTLNEALSSVVPANTCFSVLVDGVLRTVNSAVVNTSNNTVDLTLASAVTAGQSVTLAYTDATTANDTTGIIQDVALNDLASFTARTVTNNSTLTDDYSANTSTTGLVNIGSSASGNLQFIGDHDWFSVSLTAGSAYTFQQISGSLSDPLLTLRDSTGNIITSNDDNPFGGTTNSLISFTAAYTGNYYLDAGSFLDNLTGTYSLTAAASDITPPTVTGITVQGTQAILQFSEAINTAGLLAPRFSATVGGAARSVTGFSTVTGDPTKLSLTISGTAATSSQAVTVSYTDPNTGNDLTGVVQDLAGNDMATTTTPINATTFSSAATVTTLATNYTNLTLTGTAAINGTGNALANTITGNSAVNQITGGTGIDKMDGDANGDIYIISTSNDHTAAEIQDTGTTGIDELRFSSTTANQTLSVFAGDTGLEQVTIGTGTTATATTSGTTALNINAAAAPNGLTITGNNGANTLTGTAFADTINGNGGNDTLTGNAGNDFLNGGLGNDTLTGGAGVDIFRFASVLNSTTNVERITDFTPTAVATTTDRIQLENTGAGLFTAITATGTLAATAFVSGAAFTTAAQRIRYDGTNGNLFYDSDGNGAAASILFATLSPNLTTLNNTHFVVT